MKTNFFFTGTPAKTSLACGLVLAVISSSLAFADDGTNTSTSPAKHNLAIKFGVGNEHSGTNNYFGLPKEAFDRLSPEQIMELTKANEPPAAMIVIVPVAMFAMIIVCVALGVTQRLKRNRMLHETLRLMIEKGQTIPPEMLQYQDGFRSPQKDLRNGLVMTSIGIALGVLLLSQHDNDWAAALIPLLMGVAFLIAWKIGQSNRNGQPK